MEIAARNALNTVWAFRNSEGKVRYDWSLNRKGVPCEPVCPVGLTKREAMAGAKKAEAEVVERKVRSLKKECIEYGDSQGVDACEKAIKGNRAAIATVARMLAEAEAQQ